MLALGSDACHVMCAQLSARLEVLEAQREPAFVGFPAGRRRWKHGTLVHLRIAITPRKPLTTLLAL
jgi:hypothetical protein